MARIKKKAKGEAKEGGDGNYKKCWRYLRESRIYFLVIFIIFLISCLIGFFYPVFFVEVIESFIEQLIEKTSGMNFFQLLVFILKNNLTTAFVGMLLGIILGLFPLLLTFMNGYVLGFVTKKTTEVFGYAILWRVLPHGIFELPALILSLGLGLKLARFIFSAKGKIKRVFLQDLEDSLMVFVYVVLPLLIIAAIIETSLMFLIS